MTTQSLLIIIIITKTIVVALCNFLSHDAGACLWMLELLDSVQYFLPVFSPCRLHPKQAFLLKKDGFIRYLTIIIIEALQ